jgi:mRNA-degrading endonuclease HigB of HigAB toxin-antitoxin module
MCIFRRNGIEFSNDEAEKIEEAYSRLKHWLNLVKGGIVGQPNNLKNTIMDSHTTAEIKICTEWNGIFW